MADAEETVVGGQPGWWRRHGLAVAILLVAASISFIIRVIYAYQLIDLCNIAYCYAGGSDSFYHSRVMEWIISTHTNLIHDPELNYPIGSVNPREPLFDWMNAILGIIFAPFFGGNPVRAGMWVLEMQPPFWAAVGVFPVYLIGKEVSSRRMGLMAALLYPLVVGNIQSTVATYANYLPFYTFFVLLSAYCYLHTVRLSGTRRWVESYRSPRAIWEGVKQFARTEEHSVKWAVMAGVSLGATMFAWQGYTYVITIIMVFLVITLLVERIRKHDSFGAYLVTLLSGTLGFLMAMPYYWVQGEFGYWFTVPLLLFFGGLLALLPFVLLRDSPWVISVPALVGSVGAAAGALYLYNPSYFDAVVTGQGYFVKNLIFSTVAEAQAPSFDALIVSYGIGTFLLTFVGLALFVAYLFVYRFRREHIFMAVLGLIGIYLPISAAKFFLLGSPVFVLLPAEALLIGLDRIGAYPQLRRNLSSLSERGGGRFLALRRSIKLRHMVLGLIVVLVVMPNVSWAVDAGIPYNVQGQYSQQIYASLPTVLQTSPSNASSFYLGIAGIQTDTPQQYDESGYSWLSTQDTFEAPEHRPAFVSWWDYGFQAIDQGQHPSVADNFQEGIDPAGNFLLAQNESLAIAYMTADLLEAQHVAPASAILNPSGCPTGTLYGGLRNDGVNTTQLYSYLVNTSQDVKLVENNPGLYGPKDNSHLDSLNAMYDAVSYLIASSMSENKVVQVYQDVQACTGWSIRYAMADTRLFPTSGSNTGIYYAPVDLTDGIIGPGGIPTTYFTVTVTGSDGQTYPLGQVPQGVQTVSSNINYLPAFYNSMIYKIEAGYNGSQVGAGNGIPGLTLSNSNPEPGWMMQHFVMGYRTAYYCPYTNYQAHPNCFSAVNLNVAQTHQTQSQGTSDLSPSTYFSNGGETIMEYYAGASIQGKVTMPNGVPVPGIRMTVDDSWGYPHMTTVTNSHGDFTLLAPPGNDSIYASYGTVTPLTQVGVTQVDQYNLTVRPDQGFGYNPAPITPHIILRPGTITGVVYWNRANQTTFQASDIAIPGATVTVDNGVGSSATTTSDASGTYSLSGLAPGAYNVSVTVGTFTSGEAPVSLVSGATATNNIPLHLTDVHGLVRNQTGSPVTGALVTITGTNGYYSTDSTLPGGNYSFTPLPPGNYSIQASDAYGRSSVPAHVGVATFQTNLTVNFTLSTPVEVNLLPLLNGNPVPNLPVRFSALGGGANGSYLFFTGSGGWIHATVSIGNWSVYALGVVNGTYVAGIGDFHLTASNAEVFSGGSVLTLSPADPLSGRTYDPTAGSAPQSGVTVTLQDKNGAELTTTTNSTGAYRVWLPDGTYAVTANVSRAGQSGAAMAGVVVNGPTTLDLTMSTSVAYRAQVGYFSPQLGTFEPLTGVGVNLTLDQAAATVRLTSGPEGNLSFILPQTTSSFTLTTSVYGFSPYHLGPVPESTLTSTSRVVLNISQVPVQVLVRNASGASASPQVNFTGLSASTRSVNVTGTNVTLELYPGEYSVGAWAPIAGGGVLRPFTNSTLSVPIGSSGVSLALSVVPSLQYRVNSTTYAVSLSGTKAELSGALGTLTFNGTRLLRGFDAPSGSYNLWLTGLNGSQPVSFFDPVTLYANGTASPSKVTLLPAGVLDFSMRAPFGREVNTSLAVGITNGNGTSSSFTTYASGNATLTLPRGGYTMSVNTTALLDVNGVTQYWAISTNPRADTCAVAPLGSSNCVLTVNVTRALDVVAASLQLNGASISGGTGTVTAIPFNGAATEVFPVSGSSVSLSLLPGRYTLYTVLSATSAPMVNVTTLTIPYSASPIPVVLDLQPGWVQTLAISGPSGLPTPSSFNLSFSHPGGGLMVNLTNVSFGSYALALPSGSYHVQVSSFVAPWGPRVDLLGTTNLTVAAANSYVPFPLQPQYQRTVSMTLVGNPNPVTGNGGTVSYQIVVNNTGNAPLSLTASGAPSTWPIRFSPGNFTLGPATNNRSRVIEVQLTVPLSEPATIPTIVFQLAPSSGGSAIASVNAPLTLIKTYQFTMGATTSFNQIRAGAILLGFHMTATGNSGEQVSLSVGNGAELSQDGWSYVIAAVSTGQPVYGTESITPGAQPFQGSVELFPHSPAPIIPGSVQVLGVDSAHPQVTGIAYLTVVGHATIALNATPVVSGPSVGGSPPPDYQTWLFPLLTVLPAIVIVAVAGSWRWWKTRRWTRR